MSIEWRIPETFYKKKLNQDISNSSIVCSDDYFYYVDIESNNLVLYKCSSSFNNTITEDTYNISNDIIDISSIHLDINKHNEVIVLVKYNNNRNLLKYTDLYSYIEIISASNDANNTDNILNIGLGDSVIIIQYQSKITYYNINDDRSIDENNVEEININNSLELSITKTCKIKINTDILVISFPEYNPIQNEEDILGGILLFKYYKTGFVITPIDQFDNNIITNDSFYGLGIDIDIYTLPNTGIELLAATSFGDRNSINKGNLNIKLRAVRQVRIKYLLWLSRLKLLHSRMRMEERKLYFRWKGI